jgi:uncharacterized coiled-coil protein SlyX
MNELEQLELKYKEQKKKIEKIEDTLQVEELKLKQIDNKIQKLTNEIYGV